MEPEYTNDTKLGTILSQKKTWDNNLDVRKSQSSFVVG